MNNCDGFEAGFQALMEGNPDFAQLETIVEHCKICADCRELFELHRTLGDMGQRFDEMESVDLEAARAVIIENMENMEKASVEGRKRRQVSARRFAGWMPFSPRPFAAAAALAIVFVLGFAVSRTVDRPPAPPEGLIVETLINESLKDIRRSPYIFSNVAVKELSEESVTLVFDVTRRIEIVQPPQSDMVKGILTHSLANPYATGAVGHFQNLSSGGKSFY